MFTVEKITMRDGEFIRQHLFDILTDRLVAVATRREAFRIQSLLDETLPEKFPEHMSVQHWIVSPFSRYAGETLLVDNFTADEIGRKYEWRKPKPYIPSDEPETVL